MALAQLWALGARSLEFPQDRLFDPARRRSIMAAQDAGFRVTLHAPSEGAFDVAAFAEASFDEVRRNWETFLAEANALGARQGGDLVLATHGAALPAVGAPWRELARRSTTAFLVWLVEHADNKGYGLRFGFENRPRVSGYTIAGDSHAEALAIVEEVEARAPGAPRHLGTTWDMGHTAVNAYNRTEPAAHPRRVRAARHPCAPARHDRRRRPLSARLRRLSAGGIPAPPRRRGLCGEPSTWSSPPTGWARMRLRPAAPWRRASRMPGGRWTVFSVTRTNEPGRPLVAPARWDTLAAPR